MVTCQPLGLLILLFLDTASASSCTQYCVCSPPDHGPVKMNCSFKELVVLPMLPNSIQELYLQNNKLETIWAGAFDHIPLLQIINLSSNPWHCDCGILYLKNWLQDHKGLLLTGDIRCSTPPSLNKRLVSELQRSDLPSCSRPQIYCSSFLFNDAAIFCLMLILFLLLIGIMSSIKRTQLNVEVCNNSTTVPGILPSTSDQLKSRAGRLTSNSSLLGAPVH